MEIHGFLDTVEERRDMQIEGIVDGFRNLRNASPAWLNIEALGDFGNLIFLNSGYNFFLARTVLHKCRFPYVWRISFILRVWFHISDRETLYQVKGAYVNTEAEGELRRFTSLALNRPYKGVLIANRGSALFIVLSYCGGFFSGYARVSNFAIKWEFTHPIVKC